MTEQELRNTLAAKGYHLEIRTKEETGAGYWAYIPFTPKEVYLGVCNRMLEEPLHRFLASEGYQTLGTTREELIEKFVAELPVIYGVEGHDAQMHHENLLHRVARLYDDLRRTDW